MDNVIDALSLGSWGSDRLHSIQAFVAFLQTLGEKVGVSGRVESDGRGLLLIKDERPGWKRTGWVDSLIVAVPDDDGHLYLLLYLISYLYIIHVLSSVNIYIF